MKQSAMPFDKLGLSTNLLRSLNDLGYELPTPIQEQSIPILLEGNDLLAQAQTGTGKTAAFTLPILTHLDIRLKQPQALIIAPTRELAIQVAEAFQNYAKYIKGFHVLPIYGGQDYRTQLRALKRGAHVIVGTPGRVMDHLRRGTLSIDSIKTVVLDEADEMLNMGFIDDIKWIFEQITHTHQTALFSATMPSAIQKIAKDYLKSASKIHIQPNKSTVDSIEQFYIRVSQNQKLEVLTRFIEVEEIQAAIIFTRTKNSTTELARKLQARGYAVEALNGDMIQSKRQKVIEKFKNESLDIIVATDVAARGINVVRVSHVINYDIPHDSESYIHRIGRTGRAGRKGKTLLFVTPREQRLLRDIERAVRLPIKQIEPPSLKEMNEVRSKQIADKIVSLIGKEKKLKPYYQIVDNILQQNECTLKDVAASLAYLIQQSNGQLSEEIKPPVLEKPRRQRNKSTRDKGKASYRSRNRKKESARSYKKSSKKRKPAKTKSSKSRSRRKK